MAVKQIQPSITTAAWLCTVLEGSSWWMELLTMALQVPKVIQYSSITAVSSITALFNNTRMVFRKSSNTRLLPFCSNIVARLLWLISTVAKLAFLTETPSTTFTCSNKQEQNELIWTETQSDREGGNKVLRTSNFTQWRKDLGNKSKFEEEVGSLKRPCRNRQRLTSPRK
jgi:hypothetical protein